MTNLQKLRAAFLAKVDGQKIKDVQFCHNPSLEYQLKSAEVFIDMIVLENGTQINFEALSIDEPDSKHDLGVCADAYTEMGD